MKLKINKNEKYIYIYISCAICMDLSQCMSSMHECIYNNLKLDDFHRMIYGFDTCFCFYPALNADSN